MNQNSLQGFQSPIISIRIVFDQQIQLENIDQHAINLFQTSENLYVCGSKICDIPIFVMLNSILCKCHQKHTCTERTVLKMLNELSCLRGLDWEEK